MWDGVRLDAVGVVYVVDERRMWAAMRYQNNDRTVQHEKTKKHDRRNSVEQCAHGETKAL